MDLNPDKMLQIGMDGPNVNLKLHRLYVEDRKAIDPDTPGLIDIGVCSLHVVHGSIVCGNINIYTSYQFLFTSIVYIVCIISSRILGHTNVVHNIIL